MGKVLEIKFLIENLMVLVNEQTLGGHFNMLGLLLKLFLAFIV